MSNLQYIKAGQKGTGILIERDSGFIDPTDIKNQAFINEINKISEGTKVMVEPLVLFVILQKYDVINKNGRIYPKHILMREANNYQKLIDSRQAIGECVPKHTQIYTKDGWKEIQDVKVNEEIFTLNVETNKLEIQKVLKTTEKDYNDDMVSISNNSSLDMLVTKKHKIVLWDRSDKPYILTAEELYQKLKENNSKVNHSYIRSENETPETNYIKIFINKEIKTELVPFNDKVYCVTVENGTWLMKYNNKISWTHNSDHPENTIISNDRVSHEIKKIWWEGHTLVGEIEILMSPGFVNQGIISCEGDRIANMLRRGIRVGVSSRGVGSLDERNGKLMVQEDFELICWDIVTSPSTPGSYMFSNPQEAKPFMESEQKTKSLLIDKLNKFLIK